MVITILPVHETFHAFLVTKGYKCVLIVKGYAMRTKTPEFTQLKKLGDFFRKIATAIVSGLPRQTFVSKPMNKTVLYSKNENFKGDNKKHYHHPIAKPVVEKQTLLKETKKMKSSY